MSGPNLIDRAFSGFLNLLQADPVGGRATPELINSGGRLQSAGNSIANAGRGVIRTLQMPNSPFASPTQRLSSTLGSQNSSWERGLATGLGTPLIRRTGPGAGGTSSGNGGGSGSGGGGGGLVPNPKPLGNTETTTTDPATGRKPKPYPTEPRPLSAEELGALADRRLAVDTAYQEALAARERGEGSARVSSLAQRQMVDRNFDRTSNDFLDMMGGRGLARSPMFAGKGMRRMQQDREAEYGEIESNLSNELSALEEMVNRSRIERDMEMARISQDEAMMRSNPMDYLLAANQYL